MSQPVAANFSRFYWSEKIIRHLALHVLPFPSSCSRTPSDLIKKKTYSAFLFINSPQVSPSLCEPENFIDPTDLHLVVSDLS
jgi:hypothetical protein